MTVQFIRKADGSEAYAVLPYQDYMKLVARAEEREDNAAFDDWAAAPGETIPAAVVDRLLAGDNPVLVWRECRGLTQEALGRSIGKSRAFVSMLETGRSGASLDSVRDLADALDVDVEDLMPARNGADKNA